MAFSIESLGEIIKEYAKKQKSIAEKLKLLEKKRGPSPNANVPVKGPSTTSKGSLQSKRLRESSLEKTGGVKNAAQRP